MKRKNASIILLYLLKIEKFFIAKIKRKKINCHYKAKFKKHFNFAALFSFKKGF